MTKIVSQLLTEIELKSDQKDQKSSDDLVGFEVTNSLRQFNQKKDKQRATSSTKQFCHRHCVEHIALSSK